MKKTIENKKEFILSPLVLFLLTSTLMAAHGNVSELKVTQNINVTKNHHSMSMDQNHLYSKQDVTENIFIITNPSIIVYVNGMVCSFCAQGIKKSFKRHKSIKDVTVSLKNKTVELKLNRFRRISDKTIKSIIIEAGYNVKEIKR